MLSIPNDKGPNSPSMLVLEREFDKLHWGCFKLPNYVYMITFNLYAFNDHKLHAKLVLQLAHAPFEALGES